MKPEPEAAFQSRPRPEAAASHSLYRRPAMGTFTPSTTTASTVTTTTATTESSSSTDTTTASQLLEITVISAHNLALGAKSLRTYAVVWVHPDRKLTTRIDDQGHTTPTWNEKFVFSVDNDELNSETSAVMVEIYTSSWFRDNLVGTVRVLLTDLLPPYARAQANSGTRFVALQVRRASGSPQGILNMGVSLVNSTMTDLSASADLKMRKEDLEDEEKRRLEAKIQLWRSRSEKSEPNYDDYPPKGGSMCNGTGTGSTVNGSELSSSDVGPSASIVAAAIAKGLYPENGMATGKASVRVPVPAPLPAPKAAEDAGDGGSSILEDLTVEEAVAKGYKSKAVRWRAELPPVQRQGLEKAGSGRHSRRHSDNGLFSCFAYGIEFHIVCGSSSKNNGGNSGRSSKKIPDRSIKRSPSAH
ncbi:uncharacterized protein LOC127797664 [Diospyros lotus]|uniref:uncharacterized protein LOC127797664 n=1 Tax=Diospyros lotus TaxID=55363 RepID=UPI0022519426|nr:uncharacterized protein LOC127797664 [Diospyros lotus]